MLSDAEHYKGTHDSVHVSLCVCIYYGIRYASVYNNVVSVDICGVCLIEVRQ